MASGKNWINKYINDMIYWQNRMFLNPQFNLIWLTTMLSEYPPTLPTDKHTLSHSYLKEVLCQNLQFEKSHNMDIVCQEFQVTQYERRYRAHNQLWYFLKQSQNLQFQNLATIKKLQLLQYLWLILP